MDSGTYTALVALGTAISTGIGLRFFDWLIALRKGKDTLEEKKFDDGVLRRQELIKEIEYLRAEILRKDKEAGEANKAFESLRQEFFNLSINYTKLQGDYRDVVEKLEEFKQGVIRKIDEKKDEIIAHANGNLSTPPPVPPLN